MVANPASVAGPRCEDGAGRWPASSVRPRQRVGKHALGARAGLIPRVFSRGQLMSIGDLRTASRHTCVSTTEKMNRWTLSIWHLAIERRPDRVGY
jgi:hypothetical protein